MKIAFILFMTFIGTALHAQNVNSASVDSVGYVNVEPGWNLIALPVNPPDRRKAILFPSAESVAYSFVPEVGYVVDDTLETGKAYWIKFSASETFTLTGTRPLVDTIEVLSGWNMIGSTSASIDTGSVFESPEGIRISDFYSFSDGYVIADSLKEGKGYWVKAASTGTLHVPLSGSIPTIGLIAHYLFNGDAQDVSGNDNHGTLNGNPQPAIDRSGAAVSSYEFDGVDDYIEVSDHASLRPDYLTISAWLYPRAKGVMAVLYKSVFGDATQEQYAMGIEDTSQILFGIKRESSCVPAAGWYRSKDQDSLHLNQWVLATVTWNGSEMRVYRNGVLKSIQTAVPPGPIDSCAGGNLRIGAYWSGDLALFKGKIDDVRLYNRPLNNTEIMALYNELPIISPSTDGLVAHYPFNGNAIDASGNGNNGTSNGASLTTDRYGISSSAYSFDGINDYVEAPDAVTLRPALITLAAWVNPNTTTRKAVIYKSAFADAANEQYALGVELGVQALGSIKRNSACISGAGWNSVASTDTVPVSQWTFLCLTWDGVTLKTYYNGVLNGTNPSVPGGAIDDCAGSTLRLGAFWSGDPAYFDGKIDDIRIYNRALSDAEILTLYNE